MNLRLFFCGLICCWCLACTTLQAQTPDFNLSLVGDLSYPIMLNDIWGYVDTAGNEYALVGRNDGLSIVSLANPSTPVELHFIGGNTSIWRDIKVWNQHAYVSTEGGGGLLVVDLSQLPSNAPSHYLYPAGMGASAHNLFIDEQGIMFALGSQFGGGPLLYDLTNDPDTPAFLGAPMAAAYSHDAFARGDTLWSAAINNGYFSVYDMTNKSSPTLLATQNTPKNFCHNIWLSDDGQTLFTTDEKTNAWIGAYDVSDLTDIREIDRWRTPNTGVVPHNVFVHGDFLVISHYVDGVIILDASRPHNLVEVGRYDTYPQPPQSDFDGCWGVYPYLPSGLLLASDRQNGLQVLQPNYQHACWLEGLVSDSLTGQPIFGASVKVVGIENIISDLSGQYKTGTAQAGSYQIEVQKYGYLPKTLTVNLQNNQLTTQNIPLVEAPTAKLTIHCQDDYHQTPINNTLIEISNADTAYQGQTNSQGDYTLDVYLDTFQIAVGKWGYQTQLISTAGINQNDTLTFDLHKGYTDPFVLDLGWTLSGQAQRNPWQQLIPQAINIPLPQLTADSDDLGLSCMTTGALESNQYWLANERTTLSTPPMDLSQTPSPQLTFQYYYQPIGQVWDTADTYLTVSITNGPDTAILQAFSTPIASIDWQSSTTYDLQQYITLNSNVRIHFEGDGLATPFHRIWLDDFAVIDSSGTAIATKYLPQASTKIKAFPNPSTTSFHIQYEDISLSAKLAVHNALGQCLLPPQPLHNTKGQIQLGKHWPKGIYIISIGSHQATLIKQ